MFQNKIKIPSKIRKIQFTLKREYEDMDQQLKQRLKHKRRIILKNVQNVFSFTKLYDYFLFDKNT